MTSLFETLRLPPTLKCREWGPASAMILPSQLDRLHGSLLFNSKDRCTRVIGKVLNMQSIWVPGEDLRTSANSDAMVEADRELETVVALLKEGSYISTDAEQQPNS
jgi:hypothetical protein